MSALTARGSTRSWRRLRAFVLDRDGHRCRVPLPDGRECGQYATHADHIITRADGGTDDPDNLRAACADCNLRRGADRPAARRVTATRSWSW